MRILIRALGISALAVAASSAARAEGLPQLNAEHYSSQVIWLAISFVILYVLMWRVALPRISRVLEERQDRIEGNLERAEGIKRDAEAAAEAYEKTSAESRASAQAVIAEARDKLAAEAAARHAKLAEKLAKQVATAEQRVLAAKQEALANLREMAVDVAQTAAMRLTGEKIDGRVVDGIVDKVLKERE